MNETVSQGAMFGLDLHDPSQRASVERALEGLTGMVAVRLVPGFERPVDELHALVTDDRSPKQVVRDIQSLLYTRFDLSIDHRVVSVVQLAEDDPIVSATVQHVPPRVVLTRTSVTQSMAEATVTVVLTDGDGNEHSGLAAGDVSPASQRSGAGRATLAALAEMLPESTTVSLADLDLVQCGGVDIVVAVLEVRSARTDVVVTGSSGVRRGEVDAACRAVLNGLNRMLQSA